VRRRKAAAPSAKALFELAKERNEAEPVGGLDGRLEGQLDRMRRALTSDQGEAAATRATPNAKVH
jgi:hypothetical protein